MPDVTDGKTIRSPASSRTLALAAMIDLGLFFAVLLVGFAFIWRRGDLDWVRAVHHPATPAETAALVARLQGGDLPDECSEHPRPPPDAPSVRGCWPTTSRPSILGSRFGPTVCRRLAATCATSRDLAMNMLHCITAVDYFEPDPKKAAQVDWQPHLELIYHLSSITHRHRLVFKVRLPRWRDDRAGRVARGRKPKQRLEHGRVARARSVRPDGRLFSGAPRSAANPLP